MSSHPELLRMTCLVSDVRLVGFWNKSSVPTTVTNTFWVLPPAQRTVPTHLPTMVMAPVAVTAPFV